jgi:hypothetical protein
MSPNKASILLPLLSPDQALLLVNFFDRAAAAIWHAHGDAMADHLACVDPDAMHKPYDADWATGPDDKSDIPF